MVMGELFLHLKRNMEYDLEKTVIALVLKSGDTNKFLREDCHVALDHMVIAKIKTNRVDICIYRLLRKSFIISMLNFVG